MARSPPGGVVTVVALIPAKDREESIPATVAAVRAIRAVDRVLVVDDGSTDETSALAAGAGAEVLRLPVNAGKGSAVRAGVDATPEADIYLLIDADLGGTAAQAERLLAPVLDGDADLAIGVLPGAAGRGGFGLVKRMAGWGVRRASGYETQAPLSGQRAVRASLVRGLGSAERFGLEVAMTIDAARAGARIVEVDVAMEHRHTGRSLRGFTHRARQGSDIARSLWPRLTTARTRIGLIVVCTVLFAGWMVWSGDRSIPSSVAPTSGAEHVLIVGVPGLSLSDLGTGGLPALDEVTRTGATAAASVRTLSSRPSIVEAYATLGAGARVKVSSATGAEQVLPGDAPVEGATAAEVVARRTGRTPDGEIVVLNGPAAVRGSGTDVSSRPGALGAALRASGEQTAVVGSADYVAPTGEPVVRRPTGISLMDATSAVGTGTVDGSALLVADPAAPYGLRADLDAVVARTMDALDTASVVVVDPGDTDRALQYAALSSPSEATAARTRALQWADQLVGDLIGRVDEETLVLVVGLTPSTSEWELTPVLAAGAGVVPGYLHSPSTKRLGLVTITDIAPTVLDALGLPEADGMIGAPLRYHPGTVDLDRLTEQNDRATDREGIYFPMAMTFIVVQALVYLFAILVLSQGAGSTPMASILRFVVVAFAAWPLATFVYRALPAATWGDTGHAVVWGITAMIALLALRARRHPLSPFVWVTGLTVALLLVDVATGARLQMSSILGYSPHTAARYTGFGNTAFAVLAASAIMTAGIHVQYAPRRKEALVAASGLLFLVFLADAAPTLGADVGGVLTLVPVFGLMVWVLSGHRVTLRTLLVAGAATVLAVGLFVGIDLARAPDARTHLGNFVSSSESDHSTFMTTISRKWSTNVALFGKTIWTWMVPITSIFLVYVLVVAKGWQRLLPPRSALRAAVVGTVFAGLIGWLVNDSGVVVSALVFVYIGPFLTLLAVNNDRGQPTLLPAAPSPPPVEGTPATTGLVRVGD
jgi:hypothetical protein